jgi:hypothetical protein
MADPQHIIPLSPIAVLPASPRARKMMWVMVAVAAAWVLHTLSGTFVVGIDRTTFMRHKVAGGFIPWPGWRVVLAIHATAAAIAVATGVAGVVLQATRRWRWHRWAGKAYVTAVLLSAIAGLPLAVTATGGPVAAAGFLVLDLLWISTTIVGYITIRRLQLDQHRKFMYRSYALTLANTSLHVVLVPLTRLVGDRMDAYRIAIWLCFTLNLALVEIYLRWATRRQLVSWPTTG